MGLSVGGAIYIAVKPLVKIFLNCFMGYMLAKKNILTVEVIKSVSVLVVNWLMPALIFYNVINCIKGADIALIGVFVLTNFIYETLGFVFALICKLFTPNPRYWTGGLLIAGSMTNIGDIPIAYITTLAGGSLFSSDDAMKGTAYSVIFLTTFIFTFFNLGSYRLIERDFTKRVRDIEEGKYVPNLPPEPSLRPLFDMIIQTFRRLVSRSSQPATAAGAAATKEKVCEPEPISEEKITIRDETIADEPRNNTNGFDDAKDRNKPLPLNQKQHNDAISAFNLNRRASITSYRSTGAIPDRSSPISPQSSASSSQRSNTLEHSIPVERFHTTGSISSLPKIRKITSVSGVKKAFIPEAGLLLSTKFEDDSDEEDKIGRRIPPENIKNVINAYSQTNRLEKVISRHGATPRVQNPVAGEMTDMESIEESLEPISTLERIATSSSVMALKKKKRSVKHWMAKHKMGFLWEFLSNFMRPPSMALIISITLTMIPWTRALFHQDPGHSHGIPMAPDGHPPLSFIMDITSFVGAAEVPLGLATLGATISRLSLRGLPKGFWKSVVLMTLLKLVVLPIIAIAWAQKMRSLGWIAADNHIAIFVMIISSGVPSATSQVYLTAIYSDPESEEHEEMDCLAANLIAQYSSLLFTMTILVSYTLKKVIGF